MTYAIDLKNITYKYDDEENSVLKDVSFQVKEGEFVLIVGPSGSGKTTLCQTFNGIIPNMLGGELIGEVIVDGKDVPELELKDMASSIGLVFQDPDAQLCNVYVEDEVAFAPENLMVDPDEVRERVTTSLNQVGLSDFRQRKVFELSGGQKQKVGVASVLSMQPKILVFDNATANLDPQATKDVFDLLEKLYKEKKHTIVVVESKIDDLIHLVDRLVVMEEGRIICDGPPQEVLSKNGQKLMELGLWFPEISELAFELKKDGYQFKEFPISIQDAYKQMNGVWSYIQPMDNPTQEQNREEVISVKNLSYRYKNGTKALNKVSFSINKGDFVAVLGTNGSGKTTLIKHLMGIISPPQRKIKVNGEDIAKKSLLDMTNDIGFVFQNPEHQFVTDNVLEEAIYSLRVRHNLNEGEELPEELIQRGMEALQLINLADSKDKNPFMLSGGEKRRLSVVASLILGQDIVILDEPTTGQDYASATKLLELCHELHKQGKTVIMITHDIRLVCRWATKALVLNQGNLIYDGDVQNLFLQEDILKKASLIEPPISQLAKLLSNRSLSQAVITVDQFKNQMKYIGAEAI
ncbi:ABC transporter ATP-binding protein [Neobacillus notoginsengisoli]|uniref:ABC transporter ATP-binding protein n=1 Tax=Neobacillus notoginsengisoli TaxID=1578198 RepID=A0A417YTR9_9BACI|nr:ABC transporter ATP-binding protein [Neobacillus notoginsengisoli]RHW40396.1 ABC transporter ATP-binding protein [Neobacillus notoginsengisoli]